MAIRMGRSVLDCGCVISVKGAKPSKPDVTIIPTIIKRCDHHRRKIWPRLRKAIRF